jgi:hypothetical protein
LAGQVFQDRRKLKHDLPKSFGSSIANTAEYYIQPSHSEQFYTVGENEIVVAPESFFELPNSHIAVVRRAEEKKLP